MAKTRKRFGAKAKHKGAKGNPLKLCNAIDEEWRQKRKKRSREKRSKLMVQKSK
jgi:hypothetical protein